MYFWYAVVIDKSISFLAYLRQYSLFLHGDCHVASISRNDNQFMKEKFILILPNIRSGHNVGAIFRTADDVADALAVALCAGQSLWVKRIK